VIAEPSGSKAKHETYSRFKPNRVNLHGFMSDFHKVIYNFDRVERKWKKVPPFIS